MKITILYRPNSEFARPVEEFARDFERVHAIKPILMSVETREGASIAATYDIVRYPTILAARDSGELLQFWSGEQLPLMGEVAAYARS